MVIARCIKAISMGLVGCVLLSFCGFQATCEDISERVLRLHILAASDSEEDQALKLKVRDAILQETDGLLDGVEDKEQARRELEDVLPRIEETAKRCLRTNGSTDSVHVELCEMYFTTRRYDTVTLPAGEYEALRVTIGAGEGQNWWCVVFPPMCLSGACESSMEDVLTDYEQAVVTEQGTYEVRFKVVEWYQEFCRWMSGE